MQGCHLCCCTTLPESSGVFSGPFPMYQTSDGRKMRKAKWCSRVQSLMASCSPCSFFLLVRQRKTGNIHGSLEDFYLNSWSYSLLMSLSKIASGMRTQGKFFFPHCYRCCSLCTCFCPKWTDSRFSRSGLPRTQLLLRSA